jgi:hypothetical protein
MPQRHDNPPPSASARWAIVGGALVFAVLAAVAFGVMVHLHQPAAVAPVVAPQVQPAPQPAPVPAPAVLPADVKPEPIPSDLTNYNGGYTPDPLATRRFVASLPKPTLAQAGPDVLEAASERTALLYRALDRTHKARFGKPWVPHKQGIGDCVSHGWGHACDVHLAIMVQLGDVEASSFELAATESIYGGSRVEARGISRAGRSDGSSGGSAAKFVRDWGITFRQPYPDFGFDLTTYSSGRAKDWGDYGNGGAGDNGKFDTEAKKHPVREVTLVRSFKEAAAAIQSGYPVAVCSGQGFTSTRDKDGFARASGSWAHCMCFVGVRFDRKGLLCQNSWGATWISGPKWPADQPDGSFWVDEKTCDRMLGGGDSFAVSGYDGFPLKTLKHGDWASVRPSRQESPVAEYALAP